MNLMLSKIWVMLNEISQNWSHSVNYSSGYKGMKEDFMNSYELLSKRIKNAFTIIYHVQIISEIYKILGAPLHLL